jgi:hypothetical protein
MLSTWYRFTSDPPVFCVVYPKNKILTVLDRLRATVLGALSDPQVPRPVTNLFKRFSLS